jgi:hypothetical protein
MIDIDRMVDRLGQLVQNSHFPPGYRGSRKNCFAEVIPGHNL